MIRTKYGSFSVDQIENLIANARDLRNRNQVLEEELATFKGEDA